ncbi:MAG: hypothetical protein AAGA95_10250 [Pseudomonadota bacterium]
MAFPIFPDVAPANYTMGIRPNRRTKPSDSAALQVTTFRPGARWGINANFGILGDASREDRARLNRAISFVDGVQERGDYFWYYPRVKTLGQLSRESLLVDGSGYLQSNSSAALAAWTTSGTVLVNAYRIDLRENATAEQAVTVVPGQTYSVTGEYHIEPTGGSSGAVRVGNSSGSDDLLSVDLTATSVGRFTYTFVAAGTTAFLTLANRSTGAVFFSQVGVASAGTINVAVAQSASSCRLEGFPGGDDRSLAVGDLLEINGELKRLRSFVDAFSGGIADFSFAPAMRSAAPVGAPVIIHRPSVLMQAAPTDIQYNRAGMGTLTLQMSEVFPRSTG